VFGGRTDGFRHAGAFRQVSLAHWNQDDEYGGFGGPHAMVRGGYSALLEPLAARLDVRLGAPVASIADTDEGVRVTTAAGAPAAARRRVAAATSSPESAPAPVLVSACATHAPKEDRAAALTRARAAEQARRSAARP